MTNIAALFATLTPHATPADSVGRGTRNHAELSSNNVLSIAMGWARSSGKLKEIGELLLRAKYALDFMALNRLSKLTSELACRKFCGKTKGVINDDSGTVRWVGIELLGALAAIEVCSAKLCETCHGRGHIKRGPLAVDCETCESSGVGDWSARSRARAYTAMRLKHGLNAIGKDQWSRGGYADRYDAILGKLRSIEGTAKSAIQGYFDDP